MSQFTSHCVRANKVYDWITVPQKITTAVSVPFCQPSVTDEVCGCFSNPPLDFEELWKSNFSGNVKGTVTICLTEGTLDEIDIAVNGVLVETDEDLVQWSMTFTSLMSVAIKRKSSISRVRGKYCLNLSYKSQAEIVEPIVERCFLSDCEGKEVGHEALSCEEIGERQEVIVPLPSGGEAVFYEITLYKKGYLGIQFRDSDCICVICFSDVEKILLCAPPGTFIQCAVITFSCKLYKKQRLENCWCLEFELTICQEILSLYETVISIQARHCLPRKEITIPECPIVPSKNFNDL